MYYELIKSSGSVSRGGISVSGHQSEMMPEGDSAHKKMGGAPVMSPTGLCGLVVKTFRVAEPVNSVFTEVLAERHFPTGLFRTGSLRPQLSPPGGL